MEPAFLNAHMFLAEVLYKQGKIDQAREEFAKLQELEERYRQLKQTNREKYVQQLLDLNEQQKDIVRRQIFDSSAG